MKLIVFFVNIFILSSCDFSNQNLTGVWRLSDYDYSSNLGFKYLIFDDNSSRAIDYWGVVTYFTHENKKNEIRVDNSDSILTIEIYTHDSIRVNSSDFVRTKMSPRDLFFEINQPDIDGGELLDTKSDRKIRRYFISAGIDSLSANITLRFNESIGDIRDIPLFLECNHCEKAVKEVILILDESFPIGSVREILIPISGSGIRKIRLATRISFNQKIETIVNKLNVWEEDILLFEERYNYPPRPPVSYYRFRSNVIDDSNAMIVSISSKKQVEQLVTQIDDPSLIFIIKLDENMSFEDYLEIQIYVDKHLGLMKDRISMIEYDTRFDMLNLEKKKKMSKLLPTIIFEVDKHDLQ